MSTMSSYSKAVEYNNLGVAHIADGVARTAHDFFRDAVRLMKSVEREGQQMMAIDSSGENEVLPFFNRTVSSELKGYIIHGGTGRKKDMSCSKKHRFILIDTSRLPESERNYDLDAAVMLHNFSLAYAKLAEGEEGVRRHKLLHSAANIASLAYGVIDRNFLSMNDDEVNMDSIIISKVLLEYLIDLLNVIGEYRLVEELSRQLTTVQSTLWLSRQSQTYTVVAAAA